MFCLSKSLGGKNSGGFCLSFSFSCIGRVLLSACSFTSEKQIAPQLLQNKNSIPRNVTVITKFHYMKFEQHLTFLLISVSCVSSLRDSRSPCDIPSTCLGLVAKPQREHSLMLFSKRSVIVYPLLYLCPSKYII